MGRAESTMYLFSRTVTMRGNPRDTTAYAKDICALVNERSPFDVSLWQSLFGFPVGTVSFSMLVDSRAAFVAGQAQLLGDDEYLDMLDRGMEFLTTPPEDRLVSMVHHAGGELQRAGVGSVASITAAQVEVDRVIDAMGWSIGMADLVAEITGHPVHLGTVEHGPFGELQWTSTGPDITELDRVSDVLAKDTDYIERLSHATGLFIPGTGRQAVAIRIA
jgi:hypothetical protein